MIRIAITGAGGRMGKALIEAILLTDGVELSAALERPESSLVGVDSGELAGVGRNGVKVAGSISEIADQFDVLIDFTVPAATVANAAFCAAHNKNMVIGTTGLDAEQNAQIIAAAENSAICMASNFPPALTSALSWLSWPLLYWVMRLILKFLKPIIVTKSMPLRVLPCHWVSLLPERWAEI